MSLALHPQGPTHLCLLQNTIPLLPKEPASGASPDSGTQGRNGEEGLSVLHIYVCYLFLFYFLRASLTRLAAKSDGDLRLPSDYVGFPESRQESVLLLVGDRHHL